MRRPAVFMLHHHHHTHKHTHTHTHTHTRCAPPPPRVLPPPLLPRLDSAQTNGIRGSLLASVSQLVPRLHGRGAAAALPLIMVLGCLAKDDMQVRQGRVVRGPRD